jgi:hypothetical protein
VTDRADSSEQEDLAGSINASYRETHDAFANLRTAHDALDRSMSVRGVRPWSAQEYDDYLAAAIAERRALRRYLAARARFDAARRHASRMKVRSEANEKASAGQQPRPKDHREMRRE